MKRALKRVLHATLRQLGLRVHRYSAATDPDAQICRLLANQGVDLVLDVGANEGQYALTLRRSGYAGRIMSFEPLAAAWQTCAGHAARDAGWVMAPRAALGAAEGTGTIHVAGNSASSSLLPMHQTHQDAAPASVYVGSEDVPLQRLDRLAREAVSAAARPFLKVDTQGYEREVLVGATGVLPKIVGVQLEMSLTTLYEGGATLSELLDLMEHHGFSPYALLPAFVDNESGRTLQVDGIFFREASAPQGA